MNSDEWIIIALMVICFGIIVSCGIGVNAYKCRTKAVM